MGTNEDTNFWRQWTHAMSYGPRDLSPPCPPPCLVTSGSWLTAPGGESAYLPHPDEILDGGEENPGDPEERWRVLQGLTELQDPFATSAARPFGIKASEFLRMAQMRAPRSPEPTASGFAGWVYTLYASPSEGTRAAAIDNKKQVFRGRHAYMLSEGMLEGNGSWELIHSGIRERLPWEPLVYFEIPTLHIRGTPLRASPDLVYQHRETRAVFIVSVGFTSKAIPSNLWPDVWAQLWAYAQIPTWRQGEVSVIGEIWGRRLSRMPRMWRPWDPRLRAVVKRDPRTAEFDKFFSALFSIYRGAA